MICWNWKLSIWHLRKTTEAVMVRFNRETCVNLATECIVANERDTVFLLCSFDTVAVQASWARGGTARRNGKKSPTMGGFPRQEQIPLQWEDHDGSTDGYFLLDLHPYRRYQWPVFWLRVSRCDTSAINNIALLRQPFIHWFSFASSSTFYVCVCVCVCVCVFLSFLETVMNCFSVTSVTASTDFKLLFNQCIVSINSISLCRVLAHFLTSISSSVKRPVLKMVFCHYGGPAVKVEIRRGRKTDGVSH